MNNLKAVLRSFKGLLAGPGRDPGGVIPSSVITAPFGEPRFRQHRNTHLSRRLSHQEDLIRTVQHLTQLVRIAWSRRRRRNEWCHRGRRDEAPKN